MQVSFVLLLQQLITTDDHKTGLETQINRLQHKLKDINEEFKSRLQKYIKDIAVSVLQSLRNCWFFDVRFAALIMLYFQFVVQKIGKMVLMALIVSEIMSGLYIYHLW